MDRILHLHHKLIGLEIQSAEVIRTQIPPSRHRPRVFLPEDAGIHRQHPAQSLGGHRGQSTDPQIGRQGIDRSIMDGPRWAMLTQEAGSEIVADTFLVMVNLMDNMGHHNF